jgi:cysteine desulfurase family protein
MIYLDNAATSWPKPPGVAEAMARFLDEVGANPGRSGHHRSVEAGRIVYQAREAICRLFDTDDPLRVVFTPNVTYAINLALRGLVHPGDHVITSAMEHNAVMRPLRAMEQAGLALTVVPCSPEGFLEPEDVRRALQPETTLIALNHASNVCGTVLPIEHVGRIAREAGVLLLVDAAQTAGALPLSMEQLGIDLLAFTGHKGLLGPTGTGGLIVGERVPLERFEPLVRGGTGSRSEHEVQPDFLPDKFESGTANTVGLAGLAAALSCLEERGIEAIRAHEMELTARLLEGLQSIPGVTLRGPAAPGRQMAVVSFQVAGRQPSEVGQHLDETHGIACRPGLHCAPAAHRTLGTFPAGTVRLSAGAFTTSEEIDRALFAVRELGN